MNDDIPDYAIGIWVYLFFFALILLALFGDCSGNWGRVLDDGYGPWD